MPVSRGEGSSFLSPTAALRRRAVSRGILGGRRLWTAMAFVLWGSRLLRRMIVRQEVVVSREVLKPGQRVSVEALGTTVRSERRASKKQRRNA